VVLSYTVMTWPGARAPASARTRAAANPARRDMACSSDVTRLEPRPLRPRTEFRGGGGTVTKKDGSAKKSLRPNELRQRPRDCSTIGGTDLRRAGRPGGSVAGPRIRDRPAAVAVFV